MAKTTKRITKAQEKYNKNYDARLQKKAVLHVDDYVYLKVERNNPKDHRHKLLKVVEGAYKITKTENNTVVIKRRKGLLRTYKDRELLLRPSDKPAKTFASYFNS